MTKKAKRRALTVAEIYSVNAASARAMSRVNAILSKAAILAGDAAKDVRRVELNCKACFYGLGGLAGHAFTKWKCGLCSEEGMHHNTAVPRLCSSCAEAYSLCRQCGGHLDMEQIRRKRS